MDKKYLKTLYLATFFISIQGALTAYINSTYLSNFISAGLVGLLFSFGAFLGILTLAAIPKAISTFGNYKVFLGLIIILIASLIGIAMDGSDTVVLVSFLAYMILNYVIAFSRDVFIETYSVEQNTGRIRGLTLTLSNLSWVFAPLVSALILDKFGFKSVYVLAAVMTSPALWLIGSKFKDFKDRIYERVPFWKTFSNIIRDSDIRNIYLSNFLLQFFYTLMIIYTPLYLSQYLHWSWVEIGWAFVPMLLSFVIFEYPLGRLSDRIGEKKMLYGGFALMGAATAALAYMSGDSIYAWTAMLFLTRVGAATVEVMTESYFFKKVTAKQDDVISFFRNTSAIAYIIGPILAGALLLFFQFQYLFLALGITMLLGLKYTYDLKEIL